MSGGVVHDEVDRCEPRPVGHQSLTDVYAVCSVGPSSREVSCDGEGGSLSEGEGGWSSVKPETQQVPP